MSQAKSALCNQHMQGETKPFMRRREQLGLSIHLSLSYAIRIFIIVFSLLHPVLRHINLIQILTFSFFNVYLMLRSRPLLGLPRGLFSLGYSSVIKRHEEIIVF
jgi:hypothetical protein